MDIKFVRIHRGSFFIFFNLIVNMLIPAHT